METIIEGDSMQATMLHACMRVARETIIEGDSMQATMYDSLSV